MSIFKKGILTLTTVLLSSTVSAETLTIEGGGASSTTGLVPQSLAPYSSKGCNDLFFDQQGRLYFTDQGQTGLHDPAGRVFRWDGRRLDCLIDKVPSPNGLVFDYIEKNLMIAVTRANAVWRLPISSSGRVNKAGLFVQFSGGRAGPDGLALTDSNGLVVCQTGMGLVWVHDELGRPIAVIRSPRGLGTTNCAFGGESLEALYITESDTGTILIATFPEHLNIHGKPMYSHA